MKGGAHLAQLRHEHPAPHWGEVCFDQVWQAVVVVHLLRGSGQNTAKHDKHTPLQAQPPTAKCNKSHHVHNCGY